MMKKLNKNFTINENINLIAEYTIAIENELNRLDSGETLLKVINNDFTGEAEKYANSTWRNINNYIKQNFEKDIDAKLTAQNIRDKWYNS